MLKNLIGIRFVFLLSLKQSKKILTVRNFQTDTTIKTKEIKLFLQKKAIKFVDGWSCIKCVNIFHPKFFLSSEPHEQISNLDCYLNKTTGFFHCIETGHEGTWNLFKASYLARESKDFAEYQKLVKSAEHSIFQSTSGLIEARRIWNDVCTPLSHMEVDEAKSLLFKFSLEVFDVDYLDKCNIRHIKNGNCLAIAYFHDSTNRSNMCGLKVIHDKTYCINEDCNTSTRPYTIYPTSGIPRLYVPNFGRETSQIVLTANEFDSIAINATTPYSAVSLPTGITSLPLNLLPHLDSYSEIILWFGNKLLSVEALHQFAMKLGVVRCKIIHPKTKVATALHSLKAGLNIDEIIGSAVPSVVKNTLRFSDMRNQIKDELSNKEKYDGIPLKRFYNLNKKLKGHRRGELTVLTGRTGCGKTTFLSELSLDLAMQGVSTLWGSFEIQHNKLLKCMLQQFARIKLEVHMDQYNSVADKFEKLPIILMTYNGPETLKNVLKTMYEVTYTNDIQHIVIDNLQFMLGNEIGFDRFAYQDYAISEFRKFATKYYVHITLVIHPRKEDQNLPLQLSSVFGTAKATQEADNVLIIQQKQIIDEFSKGRLSKYLEVVKNRYDGDLGHVALYFDRETLCMSPTVQMVNNVESKSNLTNVSHSNASTEKHMQKDLSGCFVSTIPHETKNDLLAAHSTDLPLATADELMTDIRFKTEHNSEFKGCDSSDIKDDSKSNDFSQSWIKKWSTKNNL